MRRLLVALLLVAAPAFTAAQLPPTQVKPSQHVLSTRSPSHCALRSPHA